MKTTFFLLSLVLLAACSQSTPTTYYTTVMIDCTETDGYKPSAEVLRAHAILPEQRAGKYFSIIPINDLAFNQHNGVFITRSDVGISYDEMSRKVVVTDYENKVDSLLMELDKLHFGTNHSQIFRAMLTEARFLMKQECDYKTMICYTDLEENSPFFSLGNRAHRSLMDDPSALQAFFEAQYNLSEDESFEGLTIEIHYIPSFKNERSFDVFFELYKNIFESRGATVRHEVSVITQVEL